MIRLGWNGCAGQASRIRGAEADADAAEAEAKRMKEGVREVMKVGVRTVRRENGVKMVIQRYTGAA